MNDKTEKKRLAVLRILKEADAPVGSSLITEQLVAMGHDVSERTIRFYLQGLDQEGLTENLGKRGRRITELGLRELETARAFEKVGFLNAKIDQMTYRMTFDLTRRTGSVVVNMSVIERRDLPLAIPLMTKVFAGGFAMGELLTFYHPGERVGSITVPEGMVGVGTVCSITLNGVLLAQGIPTHSRFGGLLELADGKPSRFVEIITYEGTSIDPLEVFIRSGMTDYTGAVANGNGRIGVGFREVPAGARDRVIELAERLKEAGLGAFLTIGWPGQPLLEIPVSEGRTGAIVIGGLNPAAILEEQGIKLQSRALAGLADYSRLFRYTEMEEQARRF